MTSAAGAWLSLQARTAPFDPLRTGRDRLTNAWTGQSPPVPRNCPAGVPSPEAVPGRAPVRGDLTASLQTPRPEGPLPSRREIWMGWPVTRFILLLATTFGVAHLRESRRSIAHKWPVPATGRTGRYPPAMAWLRPRPGPPVC